MADFIVPGNVGRFEFGIVGNTLNLTLPIKLDFEPGKDHRNPGFASGKYKWSKAEKTAAGAELEKQLKQVWEGQFELVGTPLTGRGKSKTLRPVFNIEQRPAKTALWQVVIFKDPGNVPSVRAHICRSGGRHFGCEAERDSSIWGSVALGSSDLLMQGVNAGFLGDHTIRFKPGTADMEPETTNDLKDFVIRNNFNDSIFNITASARPDEISATARHQPGETHAALSLAEARMKVARDQIASLLGTPDPIFSSIDNPFAPGDFSIDAVAHINAYEHPQSIIAHEFGHCFGLLDEYAETSEDEGNALPLSLMTDLIQSWGFHVPPYGSTKSIMSNGNTIYARHFTPFLELLRKIEPKYNWSLLPI